MKVSLAKLAKLTDSTVSGDATIEVSSVAALSDARKGQISFLSSNKFSNMLSKSNASIVIMSPENAQEYKGAALVNSAPYLTYAKVLEILHAEGHAEFEIHPSAVIADDTEIHGHVVIGANVVIESGAIINKGVSIGPGCYIGKNTSIKNDSTLHPQVVIYSGTKIGERNIIHSGAVLGADGFGFAPQADKTWYKIKQIGNVELGDDVEIGANTTIDRAALGSTCIDDGVKLDNQIQIAHNVKIGKHSAIAAGTVVAGSSIIGNYCQIGGAVAISGHLTIADNVVITGKSMVIKSIKSGGVYSSGIPTEENKKWRRNAARFRKLHEMGKKLRALEKLYGKSNDK